jgi:hypothetical protein
MIRSGSKGLALLVMAAILLATGGCGGGARVGDLRTESRSVELGGADSVSVEIFMGAGELDVSGGAEALLEADFTYNVAALKPEVDYSGSTLSVRTPDVEVGGDAFWDLDDYRYEWDLRLNDDVAVEMQVRMGAGRSNLQLGSLTLTSLEITRGAGELAADLSGSASLTKLNIDGGAGNVAVDLTGAWQQSLEATIGGGVGNRTLILPRGVGVRVQVEAGIGTVDAPGLTKEGETYTNDAYGQSDVILNIKVDSGVGNTELRLGE